MKQYNAINGLYQLNRIELLLSGKLNDASGVPIAPETVYILFTNDSTKNANLFERAFFVKNESDYFEFITESGVVIKYFKRYIKCNTNYYSARYNGLHVEIHYSASVVAGAI